MAPATLDQITEFAARATEPTFTPPPGVRMGGVDPLGMRQINFDLMDEVFPGINNVARHIRPFTLVTWAWRRAFEVATQRGPKVRSDELSDFVDRIEVLFVISHLLDDPDTDLPGKQFLAGWGRERRLVFGGADWQSRRDKRRYSTALSAPINYGPALKMLSWLVPHPEHAAVLTPTDIVQPALDAFEAKIRDILDHDAFTKLGRVVVEREEVESWAGRWSLEKPTPAESRVMNSVLFGSYAHPNRREGGELMLQAIEHLGSDDADDIREAMAGPPSRLRIPPPLADRQSAWRTLQIRQLFRLSLEALLHWTMHQLVDGPASTSLLIRAFVEKLSNPPTRSASDWLQARTRIDPGPVQITGEIQDELRDRNSDTLVDLIALGIAYSLKNAPSTSPGEAADRLPLTRARKEADAWAHLSLQAFFTNVLETWVLAQHEYWSVGRGLADARAGARVLLRLKVTLEEGGWTLSQGTVVGNPPEPTRDRLQTAISLARECRILTLSA